MFSFLIVLTLGVAILIGLHLFVIWSLSSFFPVPWPRWRNAAVTASVVLPASFLVSSVFAHSWDSAFSRGAYFLSVVWLGFFVNLFLVTISASVITRILESLDVLLRRSYIGVAVLAVSVFVSGYGIHTAMRPVVTHVSVVIPNLPEAWKEKTIVQLSDVHLGHIYREEFLTRTVETVNTLDPELVVITGDLFDGMEGDLGTLARPLSGIQAPSGALFVTGNHETYLGVANATDALEGTSVRVLDDEAVDIGGLAVVGVSYPERGSDKDPASVTKTLADRFPGMPKILLYHAPSGIDRMRETGVNLQLSGHTHEGQQFPFQYVTELVHDGHDYGLYAFGGYVLYVSSGVGTWGPPMRVGTRSEIVAITLR